MNLLLRNPTGQFAPYDNLFRIDVDEQAGLVEKRTPPPCLDIPWSLIELSLGNAKLLYAQSHINQETVLKTEQVAPTIDVFLQLDGNSAFRRSGQPSRSYGPGQGNLIHSPVSEGELRLNGPTITTFVAQLSVSFFWQFLYDKTELLERLAESIEQGKTQLLARGSPLVTPIMKETAYAMLYCPYKGLVKRLYLEGKLLEICALQIEQVQQATTPRPTSLKAADIDKLMAAREWLDEHFLLPVTLLGLARQVGLNDFKLKKGFRELFHTTVFGYLTERRLHYARHLLLDGKWRVAEVADELGYSQVHHFSNAFKKRFGYLPSALRDQA